MTANRSLDKKKHLFSQKRYSSWRGQWETVGDKRIYFRSKWEIKYAHYLETLKESGKILSWEFEPDTFWFEGIKRGVVSYLPDFKIFLNNGEIEYHEIKGWMDSKSKTKIKRMKKYHPEVILKVLQKKELKEIGLDI